MRNLLLGGLTLLIASGAAHGADLPARRLGTLAAPAVPLFTWTGFHAGVNVGGAIGAGDWRIEPATATFGLFALTEAESASLARRFRTDEAGFTGGGQIGFDYQRGAVVLGAEADFNLLAGAGRNVTRTDLVTSFGGGVPALLGPVPAPLRFDTHLTRASDWFATARVRLGVTPLERLMVYATGGLAVGETKGGLAAVVIPAAALLPARVELNYAGRKSSTGVGWAGGVGVEYAFLNNFSVKLEYLYVDLGTTSFTAAPIFLPIPPFPVPAAAPGAVPAVAVVAPAAAGAAISVRARNSFHTGRVGLNYRF